MSKADVRSPDGGPAFPIPWGCDRNGMHLRADPMGMSLRDYFAGRALAGIALVPLEDPRTAGYDVTEVARACYRLADAMLAARAKG